MTIASTLSSAGYVGDGSSVSFPIPFAFFDEADILVTEVDAAGVERQWTLGVEYRVTGGRGDTGTLIATAAPPAGRSLTLLRVTPATQLTDFVPNDPLPAEALEQSLDRLAVAIQDIAREVQRSVRQSAGQVQSLELALPAPVPGQVLGWDATGEALINTPLTVASLGSAPIPLPIAMGGTGYHTAAGAWENIKQVLADHTQAEVNGGPTQSTRAATHRLVAARAGMGGRRNLITNGDMALWQRGQSVLPDRWRILGRPMLAVSRLSGASLVGVGVALGEYSYGSFPYACRLNAQLGVRTDQCLIEQIIEPAAMPALLTAPSGNYGHWPLAFGFMARAAYDFDLWVSLRKYDKSAGALAGPFPLQSGFWRFCSGVFSVPLNTLVTGDPSINGAWRFAIDLGSGAAFQAPSQTAGYWAGNYTRGSGNPFAQAVSGVLDITGVQLAFGPDIGFFERGTADEELRLCQRYYAKTYHPDDPPGSLASAAPNSGNGLMWGVPAAGPGWQSSWAFPVPMRAPPTVAFYNPATGAAGSWVTTGSTNIAVGAGPSGISATAVQFMQNTVMSGSNQLRGHITADAEFPAL